MNQHESSPQAASTSNAPSNAVGIGLAAGILLGYPISYFFQSEVFRAKMSLGEYMQNFGDIMGSDDFRPTAILVWLGCVVLFPLIGHFLAGRSANR